VAFRLGCNLVILDPKNQSWNEPETEESQGREIHVWYGDPATSQLMLLLAYLMKRDASWSDAAIYIFADRRQIDTDGLRRVVEEARIDAEPAALPSQPPSRSPRVVTTAPHQRESRVGGLFLLHVRTLSTWHTRARVVA